MGGRAARDISLDVVTVPTWRELRRRLPQLVVGLVILVLWIPLRQRPGLGTVLNTLTVGLVIDLAVHVMPEPDLLAARIPLLVAGIVVTGLGMGLYIGAGLGPGPRDGLMTGLAAKGFPLWAVRTVLELAALLAGWVLGGNVGVGTVAFAFSIGPLGHFFLGRLHLGSVAADNGPGTAGGRPPGCGSASSAPA